MRDLKLGFKLFSTELEKFGKDAVKFFDEGYCSYIELFIEPNTTDKIDGWKEFREKYNIPFTLHAPHSEQNMTLSYPELFESNKCIFDQVNAFVDALDAQYVVVHSGKYGTIDETVRQLNLINPKRMLVENKPLFSKKFNERAYRGAVIEEVKYIREKHPCGFCLDISHNFCTANEIGENPYEYLKRFQELEPTAYHISGNFEDSNRDLHMHIKDATFDLDKIFSIIDTSKNITVETRRYEDTDVQSFLDDVRILKG